MAAKKTTTKTAPKKTAPKREPRATGIGGVALVVRISPEALAYIDASKGARPRTKFLREVLAKGDGKLGKLLGAE